MLLVSVVVHRIGLGLPDHAAIDHIRTGSEIYLLDFPLRQCDQLRVARGPQAIAFEAEVFETIGAIAGSGTISGDHDL